MPRVLLLFLLCVISISGQICLQQYLMAEAIMGGIVWAINYQIQVKAKDFFEYATLAILCSIQDAYKGNIPFTTILSISAYFEIKNVLSARHQRPSKLKEMQDNKQASIIDFLLFYCTANGISVIVSEVMDRASHTKGISVKSALVPFLAAMAGFIVINRFLDKWQREGS